MRKIFEDTESVVRSFLGLGIIESPRFAHSMVYEGDGAYVLKFSVYVKYTVAEKLFIAALQEVCDEHGAKLSTEKIGAHLDSRITFNKK